MENKELAKYIDHTLLRADASRDEIRRVCEEARAYDTASVCVNTCWAKFVAGQLKGSTVKTCVVVGFPLGAMASASKAAETQNAIADGAQEIDMVLNIGYVKSGEWDAAEADIKAVVDAAKGRALVKVILETCLLTDEEKVHACEIAKHAGADFVKTSTGFSTAGAKASDIALMRKTVGAGMGVKTSGGIRSRETALLMIEAGASRIGASSSKAILG